MSIEKKTMRDERLIYSFNGGFDITTKRIKMFGNPNIHLREDPLRLLRIAHFAAQQHFTVDENLLSAMRKNASEIMQMSRDLWTMLAWHPMMLASAWQPHSITLRGHLETSCQHMPVEALMEISDTTLERERVLLKANPVSND